MMTSTDRELVYGLTPARPYGLLRVSPHVDHRAPQNVKKNIKHTIQYYMKYTKGKK
jgi:hypothetical protein